MSERSPGHCLCGAVRFQVAAPSRFCAHCHCDNCRRAHGAAFVTWVGYPEEQLQVTAGEDRLAHYHTDTDATRSFCRDCGTTIFFRGARWPGEVHIARAAFDGPIDREPGAHAYVDHAAEWWSIDDDLPQYGGKSGVEPKTPG